MPRRPSTPGLLRPSLHTITDPSSPLLWRVAGAIQSMAYKAPTPPTTSHKIPPDIAGDLEYWLERAAILTAPDPDASIAARFDSRRQAQMWLSSAETVAQQLEGTITAWISAIRTAAGNLTKPPPPQFTVSQAEICRTLRSFLLAFPGATIYWTPSGLPAIPALPFNYVAATPDCKSEARVILTCPTPPIFLDDENGDEHAMGTYTCSLVLHSASTWSNLCYRVRPLANNPECVSNHDYFHPHVATGGSVCTGDAGPTLKMAFESGDFVSFFDTLLAVLSTYNKDSPYVKLRLWDSEPDECCSHCGREVSPDDAYYTDSGNTYCTRHGFSCSNCEYVGHIDNCYTSPNGDDLCESCFDESYTTCDRCSDIVDRADITYVESTDQYVCADCLSRH